MACTTTGIAAEGQASPFIDDGLGAEIGIPGQTSEAVEIRHRQRASQPVRIHADVGDADETARGTMEGVAGDQIFDGRRSVASAGSSMCMSKSSTSFHIGTRKQRWRCCPIYSCVICSSMASLVFGEGRRTAATPALALENRWGHS